MERHDIPAWGTDRAPDHRPGIPLEWSPHPTPQDGPTTLSPQADGTKVLRRAGREELTPVYGTAQPPRGLSGGLRRLAYRLPDHKARHWFLLLLADRVDVAEHRLASRFRLWRALPFAGAAGLLFLARQSPRGLARQSPLRRNLAR